MPIDGPSVLPYDEAHEFRMTEEVVDRQSTRGSQGMPFTLTLWLAVLEPLASAHVPA